MTAGTELAQSLVDYDRELALMFLTRICEALDGPAAQGRVDVEEMRKFLMDPRAGVGDDELSKSTGEWKIAFGYRERMRALGVALADRLR